MKDGEPNMFLPRVSKLRGDVCLLVGGYVGSYLYGAQSVIARKLKSPTQAVRSILGKHMCQEQEMATDSIRVHGRYHTI